MKKRTFIKTAALVTGGIMLSPLSSCAPNKKEEAKADEASKPIWSYNLPALPYAFDALEPYIDAETMRIHHDKHHAGYVKKLNAALSDYKGNAQDINALLIDITAEDTVLRNNGGGAYNHSLFWTSMQGGGQQQPEGKLLEAIKAEFDSMENFTAAFQKAALTRFGSGWAWLYADKNKKLHIKNSPNQDNPLMFKIEQEKGTPLLGLDVWEHAYYLKYQNKRAEYVQNFFNVINWRTVEQRFDSL